MSEEEQNSILYNHVKQISFPEYAGFMGGNEMKAFAFWSRDNTPEFISIIKFMSSQFVPLIAHLSHCINTVEYAVATEFEQKYVIPSIEAYLVCVLFHFVPPNYYGHLSLDEFSINKINAALVLWQSGLVPIYDGLTWRLHNTTSVVTTGIPDDLKPNS